MNISKCRGIAFTLDSGNLSSIRFSNHTWRTLLCNLPSFLIWR